MKSIKNKEKYLYKKLLLNLEKTYLINILPFGVCTSMANPMVAAATAAALGVLTPMPCVPVPAGIWAPGVLKVMLGGMPALDNTCKLMCAWGGVIQVLNPGQTKVIDG